MAGQKKARREFMRQALRLAARGLGLVSPNPAVGAVIVRNGRVVGRGWHRKAGLPHAEAEAIRDAGRLAKGADLYCTLEPCNHRGRTPPCTGAIVSAGIRRVFYGSPDPNPDVAGGGGAFLRGAGVEVFPGILRDECDELNRAWLKWVVTGVPWVTIKAASSLDGRIAARSGDSKWISSERSRGIVQRLRFNSDAILVGAGTVMKDDPSLTIRAPGLKGRKSPLRAILDWELETPPGSTLFRDGCGRTVVFTSKDAPAEREAALSSAGAEVVRIKSRGGRADIPALLKALGAMKVTSVLVEGGAGVFGAFRDAGIFDEIHIFYAPLLIGGAGAKSVMDGEGAGTIKSALGAVIRSVRMVGGDIHVVARREVVHGAD